jgi:hypothetical protein
MGERGACGACPSPAGFMHILGKAIGICALLLEGLIILRGVRKGGFRLFPLFYSYIIYMFCANLGMYLTYWLYPRVYPSAWWFNYLISIIVEFSVLVEISDHIFRPFPAIRSLGRVLTVMVFTSLGLIYILPTILGSPSRSDALFSFTLRASITKAIILALLFYLARHYDCPMGKNVSGIMLGFSVFVALNVVIMASAQAFGPALFAQILWFMEPLAFALCLLVWTVSLWRLAPVPSLSAISPSAGRDAESVALELNRFNSELSKFLHK